MVIKIRLQFFIPQSLITTGIDLRGRLPVLGAVLDEKQIQRILAEAESALRVYVTAEGAAVFELSAHIIKGAKP